MSMAYGPEQTGLWHGLGLEGRMEQARSVKGPGPFVISMAGRGKDIHHPQTGWSRETRT